MTGRIIFAFFIGLILGFICMMLTGGGHGYVWPLLVVFPVVIILTTLIGPGSAMGLVIVLIGLVQFPWYAYFISTTPPGKKRIRWMMLVLFHAMLVAIGWLLWEKKYLL